MRRGLVVSSRLPALGLLAACVVSLSGCAASPTFPSPGVLQATAQEAIVGEMAVAFLNRFSTTNVLPAACLLDFSDSCSGRSEELADITFNRRHYAILSARLGEPTVRITGANSATVSMTCAWDSRVTLCPGIDCTVGQYEHVAGTCSITAVRQTDRWWLCTSRFSGTGFVSPAFRNFLSAAGN